MKQVLKVLALIACVVAVLVYASFRHDLAEARVRLAAGGSVAQTACGPIEYSSQGTGPAVLVIHGSGGGYTQAGGFGRLLADAGYQVITMSRFGYLRTPMPPDASAQAQADAHACLLDALGVPAATAFGASAGAPSAMQFCLRHAQRCTALVLLVPAAYAPGRDGQATAPPSPFMQFVFDRVLASDFAVWSLIRLQPELLVETLLATPREVFRRSSERERRRALAMLDDIFPVSLKAQGLQNDARICTAMPRYALERITVPLLAISVEDDRFGTYASARYIAEQVPGARLVSYPTGGHVWLGHDAEVRQELLTFLRSLHAGPTAD